MTIPRRDLSAILAERRSEWAPFLPPPWTVDALCAQTDPAAFFPSKGGSVREAKAVCAGCPVAALCLEYALENDERAGVWGSKTPAERRKLARQRRAA